jgi:hypothetical protein
LYLPWQLVKNINEQLMLQCNDFHVWDSCVIFLQLSFSKILNIIIFKIVLIFALKLNKYA